MKGKEACDMDSEQIMNSGMLYPVWNIEPDPHYYDYLQQMEEYNAARYTPDGEACKAKILRELCSPRSVKVRMCRLHTMQCGAASMCI